MTHKIVLFIARFSILCKSLSIIKHSSTINLPKNLRVQIPIQIQNLGIYSILSINELHCPPLPHTQRQFINPTNETISRYNNILLTKQAIPNIVLGDLY